MEPLSNPEPGKSIGDLMSLMETLDIKSWVFHHFPNNLKEGQGLSASLCPVMFPLGVLHTVEAPQTLGHNTEYEAFACWLR